MPWGRLDDGLYDHPKLDLLGRSKLPAIGLWTLSISWSNRRLTDGFVPSDRVIALGGTRSLADALVAAGLFDVTDGGYLIHDFLTFNDSAVTVQKRRDEAAERQRRHRDVTRDTTGVSQRESQRDEGVSHSTHARARALASRPDPSRPDRDTPLPPQAGARPSRENGTAPRQVAAETSRAKTHRKSQRQLAYSRGSITEAELDRINREDASLTEIPDWDEHRQSLKAEADAPTPIEAAAGPAWLEGKG